MIYVYFQGQLYEQPCCVQNQRSSPKNLVYAQVGKRPPNAPIVPPSIDKVVYTTIHSIKSTLSKSMQPSIPPIGRRWTFSTSQVYISCQP